MMNVGRCPRCGEFIVAEQEKTHRCHIRIKRAGEIFFDYISDGFTDENGDYVRSAVSLDGTLYSLIICKHNPPHTPSKVCIRSSDERYHSDPSDEEVPKPAAGCCQVSVWFRGCKKSSGETTSQSYIRLLGAGIILVPSRV